MLQSLIQPGSLMFCMNGCENGACMQDVAAKVDSSVKSQRLADIKTWDSSIPRGSWARHVMPWGCLDLDMDGTSIMGFTYSHGQSPVECSAYEAMAPDGVEP